MEKVKENTDINEEVFISSLHEVFTLARVQLVSAYPSDVNKLASLINFEQDVFKKLKSNVNNPKSTGK